MVCEDPFYVNLVEKRRAKPTLHVAVKRLTDTAKLPVQKHSSDLAMDIYADETVTIPPKSFRSIRTGIAIETDPPVGWLIKERSSFGKQGIACLAGVIDPGYRGEIIVVMVNMSDEPFTVEKGTRFAQMIPLSHYVMHISEKEHLTETDRGDKGFGSTGVE